MELSKQEKDAVIQALKYYRDCATHVDSDCAGLHRQTTEYTLITSAIEKLEAKK